MAEKKPEKSDLTHLRATLPAALEDISPEAWEEFQKLQKQQSAAFAPTAPHTNTGGLRKTPSAAAAAAKAGGVTLDQAMVLARRNNRVCPMVAQWVAFHAVLADGAKPGAVAPFAIDGGAWNMVPAMQKRLRLKEQLEWAEKNGRLEAANAFLAALPEEAWLHF